jgi:hypothetical protein
MEGLSRAARGCLCLLQHDRVLPSLVGASRWLPVFSNRNDGHWRPSHSRARRRGKGTCATPPSQSNMCFSSRATPPLGIDSLHHGTADSRSFLDELWSLSASGRRLSGLGRLRADSITSTFGSKGSPWVRSLVMLCAIGLNAPGRRTHSKELRAARRPGQPQSSTTIVGLRHTFHWACPLVRQPRLIAILRIITASTVAASQSRRLVQKQTPTRGRRNLDGEWTRWGASI